MARLRHNDPDAPVSRDEMTSMMSCISNLLAPMNQDAMNALLQVGKTLLAATCSLLAYTMQRSIVLLYACKKTHRQNRIGLVS